MVGAQKNKVNVFLRLNSESGTDGYVSRFHEVDWAI